MSMSNGVFNFESLIVYKRSVSFSEKIYRLTQRWPKEHLFGITDQLRRASLSIPLNIAEGSSRTRKDFRHFLIISRGSCFEIAPIIQISVSLNLLTSEEEKMLYNEVIEIAQMISGLCKSLDKRV